MPDSADALVTEHLYLVQHVVNALASRYPRHIDRTELYSAGALGLVEAAHRFDDTAGVPFARYATVRIRGAMIDSTRTRDLASRRLRRTMRGVDAARQGFETSEGRAPTTAELAGLLGVGETELAQRQAAVRAATLLHLDQRADDDGATLGEGIEEGDREWLPEEAIEDRELVGSVRTAVAGLPAVQREVVDRYYFRGEMLRDIAADLGVTEARVSQIRSEAVTAMQSWFGASFEGVPAVAEGAPGVRQRAAYVAAMQTSTTWQGRLAAADSPPSPADTRPAPAGVAAA